MKVWAIIRREYIEKVRTKGFVLSTLLIPMLMSLMFIIPMLVDDMGGNDVRTVGVFDPSGEFVYQMRDVLELLKKDNYILVETDADEGLTKGITDGAFDVAVSISPDYIESKKLKFYSGTVSSMVNMETLGPVMSRILSVQRQSNAGVSDSLQTYLLARPVWEHVSVNETGETSSANEESTFGIAITLIMILYMMILMYGQHTMMGVIEEKSSRIVEVVLSSVSSTQLMIGKIAGIGLAGLTQFSIWSLVLVWGSKSGVEISGFTLDGSFLTPTILASFLVFFVLGFLLFATLYAGVGAMCNTPQEAQQFAIPLMLCNVIPMMLLSLVIMEPNSSIAIILSLIPLFSPVLMFIRICMETPPLWQIGASWILMLASIWLALKTAGKLFRVGILMHGAAPSWKTLVKVLRQSD
ncbi:MAG: ABC transporter permease [bacterium]|nr:ABC transporter permease [bacterium]MCP4800754.1 ABC transporter permease [bacterium]